MDGVGAAALAVGAAVVDFGAVLVAVGAAVVAGVEAKSLVFSGFTVTCVTLGTSVTFSGSRMGPDHGQSLI